MKRKIFSALLVLILICTPLLCLTGCQSDPGNDVLFKASIKSGEELVFVVGDSQSKIGEQVTIELNYYLQKWNPETSKYQYVKYNKDKSSGYEFVANKEYYLPKVNDSYVLSFEKALAEGMTISGFNTLTATEGNEKRTLKLSFSGITHEFKYSVTAAA